MGGPLVNLVNTPTNGTDDKLLKVEYLKVRVGFFPLLKKQCRCLA